jgi:hypothetical protein
MTRHRSLTWLLSCAILASCRDKPPEPEHDRDAPAAPAASRSELTWKVPPTWNVEKTAERGLYRAKYTLPASGNAKHPAEVLVQHLGTGKKADPAAKLAELAGEFEGKGSDEVAREELEVGRLQIELIEVTGAYRFPMGPPIPGKHKPLAHVIKDDWRAIAAGVRTPDGENWLFRMVGPSDSVAAARSAFRNMIESLK